MTFAAVVGHGAPVAGLRRAAAEGRVPGAVLLLGPPGIGKRAVADAFAARLLCRTPRADDACGECPQCSRVAAGTHPDLHVVVREDERRDVRIEQVRELTRWLALQPLMADRKVGIVDDAHCLNEHAQNALLKTLEEPPGASVLVLVASAAAHVLPTVRSRCRIVRLDPLPPDDVARVLAARGIPPDRVGPLAAMAEGSPGRALTLAGEEQTRARERILAALARLHELPAHELSNVAQDVARGAVDAALAAALGWYRDVLETAVGGGDVALRNPAAASAVRAAADRIAVPAVLRQLELVCDTIADLENNANRMLSVDTMLLSLREIERGSWTSAP
jgi:DNA polymerase-3 subunit delta'